MCGYNICFMRVCYDQKWIEDERATKQYIPLDDETCCVFISHYDGVPVQSITDVLVRDVMTNRTRTRAKMKTVTDPFQYQSLDAQQLCCKVLQNAVYGACGSETFPIMCTALAASVCTIGQWMNKTVRNLAMERGCICVYGDTDSVMVQFATDPALVTREAILADIYRQARVLEHDATALFPTPNAVEFEALKLPFLMTDRKKTYAAYEFPPGPQGWQRTPTLLIKGFAVKKRDRCPMVQTIGLELVRRLLAREVADIVPWFRDQIRFPSRPRTLAALGPFVISCRLNEVYKQSNVIGPVLADQYEAECGVRPEPGNRLKYVVVYFEDGRKHYQSTMTPEAFLQSTRHLDVAYYLQKQLMLSLQQVLNQHPQVNADLQQCIRAQVTHQHHARRGIQTLHACIQRYTGRSD
jgi:DNA polymerase elongation subunit (family B)